MSLSRPVQPEGSTSALQRFKKRFHIYTSYDGLGILPYMVGSDEERMNATNSMFDHVLRTAIEAFLRGQQTNNKVLNTYLRMLSKNDPDWLALARAVLLEEHKFLRNMVGEISGGVRMIENQFLKHMKRAELHALLVSYLPLPDQLVYFFWFIGNGADI